MLSEPCPRCGKNATVTGSIFTTGTHAEFQPDGIRWLEHFRRRLFQTTFVKLKDPARACLDCSLVWSTALSPRKLREIVEREGIAFGVQKDELNI
jgi:hypothetical protein